MYAVVASANTRCATVITGAAQNISSQPTYKGCRTRRYGPGVPKTRLMYGRPIKYSQTCRNPNRSKWLIKNVATSTNTTPNPYSASSNHRPQSLLTVQI